MNLLELDNNDEVSISPYALSIPAFQEVWERDRTESKNRARKELTYIYFVADFRSNLIIYGEQERHQEAKEMIFGDEDPEWEPDESVKAAIEAYRSVQRTPSMEILESFMGAAYRLKEFFDNVDFQERDKNGKPVHDVKKVMQAMSSSHDLIQNLTKMQEQVKREIQEGSRVRGGGETSIFEDEPPG